MPTVLLLRIHFLSHLQEAIKTIEARINKRDSQETEGALDGASKDKQLIQKKAVKKRTECTKILDKGLCV